MEDNCAERFEPKRRQGKDRWFHPLVRVIPLRVRTAPRRRDAKTQQKNWQSSQRPLDNPHRGKRRVPGQSAFHMCVANKLGE